MKKTSTIFFFVFALGANIYSANAQVNKQDSLALVNLYNSTNGPNWKNNTNWLTANPVSTWHGITVNNGRVIKIILDYNKLKGTIPSSIGNLTNLVRLVLSHNQLSGNLPSSLFDLINLQWLDLFSNQLSGSISNAVGNLVNLTALYLGVNQFTGNIPWSIGNLVKLHVNLDLEYNQLSGIIPSSIGNLKKLNYLWLNNNQLTGNIPYSVGNMSALAGLVLSDNKLSGPIPSSIKNLNLFTDNEGWLFIERNNFTFDGMQLIARTFPDAIYAPQSLIPVHQNGNTLSVSAGGTLSNNTYTWFRLNNNSRDTTVIVGDSVFHPAESGFYRVKVTNAVATDLILHSFSIHYEAPAQSLITSAENNMQQYGKQNIFLVYPNPAKDIVYVQTNSNTSLSILDQSGKILVTKNISGKSGVNVSDFPVGLYYIKNNITGAVQKIVIAR